MPWASLSPQDTKSAKSCGRETVRHAPLFSMVFQYRTAFEAQCLPGTSPMTNHLNTIHEVWAAVPYHLPGRPWSDLTRVLDKQVTQCQAAWVAPPTGFGVGHPLSGRSSTWLTVCPQTPTISENDGVGRACASDPASLPVRHAGCARAVRPSAIELSANHEGAGGGGRSTDPFPRVSRRPAPCQTGLEGARHRRAVEA